MVIMDWLNVLKCPRCSARGLTISAKSDDELLPERGEAICNQCGARFAIRDYVLDLSQRGNASLLTPAGLSNYLPLLPWGYENIWRPHSLTLLSGEKFPVEREIKLLNDWLKVQPYELILDLGSSTDLYARGVGKSNPDANIVAIEMNFKYHALFFRQINFWIAIIIALLVASLIEPLRAAVLLIPFLILYAAMQGAFHFHYIIFARRYARALERKINRLNNNDVLIAHELEDAYLFPLDTPRFVGVSFGNPSTFFSAITFHYGIAGTLLWAFTLYRAGQLIPQLALNFAPLNFYIPVTLVWTFANILYLAWYSIAQRDERRVEKLLSEFLDAKDHLVA